MLAGNHTRHFTPIIADNLYDWVKKDQVLRGNWCPEKKNDATLLGSQILWNTSSFSYLKEFLVSTFKPMTNFPLIIKS